MDARRLEEIAAGLSGALAGLTAFDAVVAGLGAFPSVTRPRVVWAGVAGGAPALTELAGRVERACVALGLPPETRPFSPHITLGRVRAPRRDARLADLLAAAARDAFGRSRVEGLALMESELSPRGARYTERASARLG